MDKKTCPALSSCNHKACTSACDCELLHHDLLGELPIDIGMSIMSRFTMKEAARTSLVSHKWKTLWHHYFPTLTFEDSKALKSLVNCFYQFRAENIPGFDRVFYLERSRFVKRVNHVLDKHLGPTIDEFRVIFDLDNGFKSHIDRWLLIAFAKQVKRLELNLPREIIGEDITYDMYNFPHASRLLMPSVQPALTSLCLQEVNITAEVVECFLRSFPLLENLCIKWSESLNSIIASSLSLKHFKIKFCNNLKIIDLSAPKLLSFRYKGHSIKLHIRNAIYLSKVSIGTVVEKGFSIAYAVDSLSKYFPQLEYLKLRMCVYEEWNLGMNPSPSPAMMNLEHLVLFVRGNGSESVLGWTFLFEEAPRLQKLTLKFNEAVLDRTFFENSVRVNRVKHPIKCLKTLEVVGFQANELVRELVTYVIENATMLESIIFDVKLPPWRSSSVKMALEYARVFQENLPSGVELIVRQTYS